MLHSLSPNRAASRSVPRGRLAALGYLPRSLLVVALCRLALTFASLDRLRQWLLPLSGLGRDDLVEVGRIAWAVRTVSHVVPFASCLTQAQACQILLARRGIASMLRIGVREDGPGALAAHAWLLCNDKLVLGGHPGKVASFRVLTELRPLR